MRRKVLRQFLRDVWNNFHLRETNQIESKSIAVQREKICSLPFQRLHPLKSDFPGRLQLACEIRWWKKKFDRKIKWNWFECFRESRCDLITAKWFDFWGSREEFPPEKRNGIRLHQNKRKIRLKNVECSRNFWFLTHVFLVPGTVACPIAAATEKDDSRSSMKCSPREHSLALWISKVRINAIETSYYDDYPASMWISTGTQEILSKIPLAD